MMEGNVQPTLYERVTIAGDWSDAADIVNGVLDRYDRADIAVRRTSTFKSWYDLLLLEPS